MQPGSFLVSEVVTCSSRSIVPWADRIEENWWSLEKEFLHIFQRLEKDLEIPHRSWQKRWKFGVWLGKSDLRDEHLVRTDDGVACARSVRRIAEDSWSDEALRSVVETAQKPRSTATDDTADIRTIPEVRDHDNENEEKNKDDCENEKPPDKPKDDDQDMQGEIITEPDTTAATSTRRGEKRPETQEHVFTKKRVMMKSPKRPITPVPLSEDPVKRRLMKKTDLKNDETVMSVDADLLKRGEHAHEGQHRARNDTERGR